MGLTAAAVDHAFFGGSTIASPVLGGAVASAISLAEQITLAPIFFGEYITATSLIAAHSSINVLSIIFPGSSEASFSLASFITLVRREWSEPAFGESLPDKRYGVTQLARAIVAWVALQGVTQEWQEKQWLKSLREIHVKDAPKQFDSLRARKGSRIRVTSDVIFPGNRGQIISADIGEAPSRAHSVIYHPKRPPGMSSNATKRPKVDTPRMSNSETKATLRRLSKMVLAGYGGASLLFFGISPMAASSSPANKSFTKSSVHHSEQASEELQLAHAIDASEAEAAGDPPTLDAPPSIGPPRYSWWDVLLGKHDHEIFERFANTPVEKAQAEEMKAKLRATAVIGVEHQMPRFWVLTDHGRGQIVLVLRGMRYFNPAFSRD